MFLCFYVCEFVNFKFIELLTQLKMSQKWKKSIIFMTPSPQIILDYFEFGEKTFIFDDPPLDQNWGKEM